MTTFAIFIKNKLAQGNIPMTKFCYDLGFNKGTWSKILRDLRAPPKKEVVDNICNYFNLTPNEIELLKTLGKEGRIRMFKGL